MSLSEMSIYDLFIKNARSRGNRTGLCFGGAAWTFAQLLDQVNLAGQRLAAAGVRPGDRVAVAAANSAEYFALLGAAARQGAILVLMNWRLSAEEMAQILADTTPSLTLADPERQPVIAELAAQGAPTGSLIALGKAAKPFTAFEDLTLAVSSTKGSGGDDPFCIIHTAAVEGKPRGAVLSHNNLMLASLQSVAAMQLTEDDACLAMLPFFHIHQINLSLCVFHAGGKNVVMPGFDTGEVLKNVEEQKITVLGAFPPILTQVMEAHEKNPTDISSLRHALGIESPQTIEAFEKKTGADFWVLYGQTETSGKMSFSPYSHRPGSAGRPSYLADLKLVDEAGKTVAQGEEGEILVRGPIVFSGYWDGGAMDTSTVVEGWHKTGDLGRMDEDGYLFFAGRKPERDLIKPGGENVFPAEVEQVIEKHPAVEKAAVIGIPDEKFGEGIKAVCVLKTGQRLEAADLIAFVAENIARYKKPKVVEFVDQLPLKPDGAPDRPKVKEMYGE